MKHKGLTVLTGSCLLLLFPVGFFGQEVPSSWIPFTASVAEQSILDFPATGHRKIERTGFYARDGHGNSYQEFEWVRTSTSPPVSGPTVDVTLHDRPNQILYLIDPARKSVRKTRPDAGDLTIKPPTREEFDQAHKGEKFVGKKVISGIECEGFQTPARFSRKYINETWYTPSLNFTVIKATVYVSQYQRSEVLFKDIRIGTEPDPNLFRLPEGFKEVQK